MLKKKDDLFLCGVSYNTNVNKGFGLLNVIQRLVDDDMMHSNNDDTAVGEKHLGMDLFRTKLNH